ncbi:MAG: 16S rRNA (adenine(1518)-N(6)/adenine(1519)-N(6))-dimethyltransferase RsmA [Rhizobiales bacterium]|nr:16S rRNA (adenine(1518)-N(6)/adenine(1519)-N(6))-dimethyltransferase RsmA [Hyphomicrobiales bacterium]
MSDGLPPLREVIAACQLTARKSLGQNFLLDLNLTGRIARAAEPLKDHTIVEVGPGPGGLTRALLHEGAQKVIAIERDERVMPALEEISNRYPGRLDIIEGDALEVDWQNLIDGPAKVVANLPYNIATPLLTGWLGGETWPPWYSSLTLMFQKEVAERIVAEPGSKTFGRLSVLSQWRSSAVKLFDIDRRAFTPPPKVTSSVVQITPIVGGHQPCRSDALQRVTAAAFGQRRKMLRSSLKTVTSDPALLLDRVGIDPQLRAEQLEVNDFCRLASEIDD